MPDSWHERKPQLLLEAAKDPDSRGRVYRELFETATTPKERVADFLTEFVAQVFPRDFIGPGGKNRKVFTKKVL